MGPLLGTRGPLRTLGRENSSLSLVRMWMRTTPLLSLRPRQQTRQARVVVPLVLPELAMLKRGSTPAFGFFSVVSN